MQTILVPMSWTDDLESFAKALAGGNHLDSQWSTRVQVMGDARGLCCETVEDLNALERYEGIEVVSFTGTGISDVLEMPIVQGRSLTLCNIRDYGSIDVAEHTVALILGVAKRLIEGDRLIQARKWSVGDPWSIRLKGKILGLVGLGSIGTEVARMATALGMEVLYWSRNRHHQSETELGITYASFEELFRDADVISLHLALNADTKGIVGEVQLRGMKQGALFINTARGGLVDTKALVQVLQSGHLAGAGLDVFEEEPLPATRELVGLRNVVLSPHVGASTKEAIRRAREECLLNVVSFLSGKPRNVVQDGRQRN